MLIRMPRVAVTACLLLVAVALSSNRATADIMEMDVEGIHNYSSYSGDPSFAGARVGFGGAMQPAAMAWLRQQGYAAVISLRLSAEDGANVADNRQAATGAGLKYIHLPFDPESPAADIEARFLAAAGDPANQPVFIHCGSGTRAAILWMAGRALLDGLDRASIESEGASIAEKPEEALGYFNTRMALEEN